MSQFTLLNVVLLSAIVFVGCDSTSRSLPAETPSAIAENQAPPAPGSPPQAATMTAATLASAGTGTGPTSATSTTAGAASTVPNWAAHADRAYNPAPLTAGYQRYETTPVDVPAGMSDDWAQWVGGPLDQDYDILDIKGDQWGGGHHALVYGSTEEQPTGFTRLWRDEDQTTTRLMGGVGGEGGANVNLPEGMVFRVKKGSYILVQTHYLNPTDSPLVGRTVIDIKFAPVDLSRTVVSIMSSTTLTFALPAHRESVVDINCPVQHDLHFLQISNHMHDYGANTFTEVIDAKGAHHMLKEDATWSGDWALNPNFTSFPAGAPGTVSAGSTLHTRCTWSNTSDAEVKFPTEMCVFFGFIINDADVTCMDGKWRSAGSSGSSGAQPSVPVQPSAAAGSVAAGSSAGGGGSPSGGVAGTAGSSPPVTGGTMAQAGAPAEPARGCTSAADQAIMESAAFDGQATDCSISCAFDPDVAACTAPCFEQTVGLSNACAACNATNVACGSKNCRSACLTDSASDACRSCVMTNCAPAFQQCKAG